MFAQWLEELRKLPVWGLFIPGNRGGKWLQVLFRSFCIQKSKNRLVVLACAQSFLRLRKEPASPSETAQMGWTWDQGPESEPESESESRIRIRIQNPNQKPESESESRI